MNTKVLERYKELRQDHVNRSPYTGKIRHYKVSAKFALNSAKNYVKVMSAWKQYEDDLVRLEIVPDESYYSPDDLFGDTFNPDVNDDIDPERLAKEEQEAIERANRDGIWGIVGKFKCNCNCPRCDGWHTSDSVWGFIGDDWKDSGYDIDVMHHTLIDAGLLED